MSIINRQSVTNNNDCFFMSTTHAHDYQKGSKSHLGEKYYGDRCAENLWGLFFSFIHIINFLMTNHKRFQYITRKYNNNNKDYSFSIAMWNLERSSISGCVYGLLGWKMLPLWTILPINNKWPVPYMHYKKLINSTCNVNGQIRLIYSNRVCRCSQWLSILFLRVDLI